MWRLFKEVFKSLTKNKVVVIGLSILVFLTSAVFTLLTSVRSSMVRSFENYKKVSVLHDATVDLNIPSSGNAYNQGYFVNGESSDDLKNRTFSERFYKPIEYHINYDKTFKSTAFEEWKKHVDSTLTIDNDIKEYLNDQNGENILYLEHLKEDYIPLNLIQSTDISQINANNDLYFKKDDLLNFYRLSKNSDSGVNFNLDDINNPRFEATHGTWVINLYKQDAEGNYVQTTKDIRLENSATLNFDQNYYLGNILQITSDENNIYASQVSAAFVNLLTKEVTLKFAIGNEWISKGIGVKIEPQVLANYLGFNKINESDNFYTLTEKTKDLSNFLIYDQNATQEEKYAESTQLQPSFVASLFFDQDLRTQEIVRLFLKNNQSYQLDQSLIVNKKDETSFLRYNYYISYVDKNDAKKQWQGSYRTFIENLGDVNAANRNELWDQLETFSYWKKRKVETWKKYVQNNGQWEISSEVLNSKFAEVSLSANYNFMESEFLKLYTNDERKLPIDDSSRNAYKIEENDAKSIKEIELFNNPKLRDELKEDKIAFYNEINEQRIQQKRFDIIKDAALRITKKTIVDGAINLVGEDNIGLKKTITVDGLNKDGAKNVFHFIDTGDDNNIVEGVKLNVGKLYEEVYDPTILNNFHNNERTIFNDYQFPPFIAGELSKLIANNLYVDENYAILNISFVNIVDYQPTLDKTSYLGQTKVYWLNKYVDPKKNIDGSKIPNYEELNLGIFYDQGLVKFVKKIVENDQIIYRTVYLDDKAINGQDLNFVARWIEKNNLTYDTKFLKTDGDGWVIRENNSIYVPLSFWSINNEIIQRIVKTQKIRPLIEVMEKILLNLNIVKSGFLSSDLVYKLMPVFEVALDEINFSRVFISGKIDNSTLPKMGAILLNKMASEPSGNLVKALFKDVFNKIKTELRTKTTVEEQKAYLIEQVNNLLKGFAALTGGEQKEQPLVASIINLFNDPIQIFDLLSNLLDSIDVKLFTDKWLEWYRTNSDKDLIYNGEKYTQKLTASIILKYFIQSIDSVSLKESLTNLIDSVDFGKLFSLEDNSIFKELLKDNQNVLNLVQNILPKIDKNKDGSYSNVKDSLKNIIKNIDLDYFKQALNSASKIKFVNWEFEYKTPQGVKVDVFKFALDSIDNKTWYRLLTESLFSASGSSKAFKSNIVNLFNLSSKTSEIQSGDESIWLPAEDEDKLSLFDLIKGFSGTTNASENGKITYTNYLIEKTLHNLKNTVTNSNNSEIKITSLNDELRKFTREYLTNEPVVDKSLLLDKIALVEKFIDQTKGGNRFIENLENKSGSDLLKDLKDYNAGSATWLVLKSTIEELIKTDISDSYSLGASSFSLFAPYISFYSKTDGTFEETNKFVDDFLKFAINPEVLKLSQENEPNANIPFTSSTNYAISKFLYEPSRINIFDLNENGEFINSQVKELIDNNPKFKDFVLSNKLMLIVQLGFIGQSAKYSTQDPNKPELSAYYQTVNNFIKNYLSTEEFFAIKNVALKLANQINPSLQLEFIGISSSLLNPILRLTFPEIAISYLAVQKKTTNTELINGNLAYLVLNKLNDLEVLTNHKTKEYQLFNNFLSDVVGDADFTYPPLDVSQQSNLLLDALQFEYYKNLDIPSFFGLKFNELLYDAVRSISQKTQYSSFAFNNPRSYFAKVNFAYLASNNKAIYTGEVPNNPLLINEFVNNLDSKYVLDINGLKFIIVGQETTVDYMYPVIDENNLQVNTTNQALVYVNTLGFQRIQKAYGGNVVKSVLLVKNSTTKSNEVLKENLKEVVNNAISSNNNFERVFLTNEIDPINPERALRIDAIVKVIKAISVATTGLVLLFSFLAILSVVFVIKRYIASKNKVLGILVSQGYSPSQIGLSLCAFAIVTAVLGGILGYIIGNKLQFVVLDTFSTYWTLPKNTLRFNPIAAIFTVITPCLIISAIIYLVTLRTLQTKPLDLITGNTLVPKQKGFWIYYKYVSRLNIKKRFSFVLAYTGIWKLVSFMISIILVTSASLFGVANRNVFSNTINRTYENRSYKFKLDLTTPTVEGDIYRPFNTNDVKDLIYTPIGISAEAQSELKNYLAPGRSPVINGTGDLNGNPLPFAPHILTQFSLDINVDSSISLNPWQVSYNLMPDTQKSRIDAIRNRVGWQLEKTQNNKKIDGKTYIFYEDPVTYELTYANKEDPEDKHSFYKYYIAPGDKFGQFRFMKWNGSAYDLISITTADRTAYRQFLVEGYLAIQKQIDAERANPNLISKEPENWQGLPEARHWSADHAKYFGPTVNDYYISFSGTYFDQFNDETYTYLESNYGKIYGYKENSRFIKLVDFFNNDLSKVLYNFDTQNETIYPLVINQVVAQKRNLGVGSILNVQIKNNVNRYIDTYLEHEEKESYKFKVVGINETYISDELITTQEVANKLTGLSRLAQGVEGYEPFNGILTNSEVPVQILGSASLYSLSGYWPILTENVDDNLVEAVYGQLFDPEEGLFVQNILKTGANKEFAQAKLSKFLDPNERVENIQNTYELNKANGKNFIQKFISNYNDSFYSLLAKTIDSKDIEVGFTNQIGSTVNSVTIGIIWITLLISLTILVIISTLMIGENQKNIAIWSILGYSEKEKLKMFFSIFIPFILISILIAIPAVLLMIYLFNAFLLGAGSIVLMFSLKWFHVLIVSAVVFIVFLLTALATWYSIGKIKAIQLLKG
ncbi:ABC transporter permease [Mycoplasmopsis columbina]|uniref:ABC transporter permease n=1 Tax=Mycoplasmopsis columbina TaxID=114881 RepID=UPI0004A6BB8B|nr:FtsX-like permease family protein [Mycoplasmopsis columbina]VEU77193.1 Uncharacterized ABC transporter permease MG468 homolog [Mycoplasmopsis columbina]